MNQDLIISDDVIFEPQYKAARIYAQQGGRLISCYIPISVMEDLAQTRITDSSTAFAIFTQYRFDFEDRLEAAIKAELFNDQGEIWIQSSL